MEFIDLKMDHINSRTTKPPDKMKSYYGLDFMFYSAFARKFQVFSVLLLLSALG